MSSLRMQGSWFFLIAFFMFSSLSYAYVTTGLSGAGVADGEGGDKRPSQYLSTELVMAVLQAKTEVEQELQDRESQSIERLVIDIHERLSSGKTNISVAYVLIRAILEVSATMSISDGASAIVRAVEVYFVRQYQIMRIGFAPQATECRVNCVFAGIIGESSLELSAERISDILYNTKPELSLIQLIQAVISYKNQFPPLEAQDIEAKLKEPTNRLIDPSETRVLEIGRILDILKQFSHVTPADILRIFTTASSLRSSAVMMRSLDEIGRRPHKRAPLSHRLSLAEQVLAVVKVLSEKGEPLSAKEIREHLRRGTISRTDRTLNKNRIEVLLKVIECLKGGQGVQTVKDLSIADIYRYCVVGLIETEPSTGSTYGTVLREGKEFDDARSFFVRRITQRRIYGAFGQTLNEGAPDLIAPENLVALLSAPREVRPSLVWIPELIRQEAARQGMPVNPKLKSAFTSHEVVLSVLAAERILKAEQFIEDTTPQIEEAHNIVSFLREPGIQMDVKLDVVVNVLAARARQSQELVLAQLVEEFEMIMIQEAKIESLNRNQSPSRRLIFEILNERGIAVTEGAVEEHFDQLILSREPHLTPLQQVKTVMAAQSFFIQGAGKPVATEHDTVYVIYHALCGDQIKLIVLQQDHTSLSPVRIKRILDLAASDSRTPEEVLFQLQLEDILIVRSERGARSSKAIRSGLITDGFMSREDVLSLGEIERIVQAIDRVQADVAVQSVGAREQLNLSPDAASETQERGAMRPIVSPDGAVGSSLEISIGEVDIGRAAQRGLRAAGVRIQGEKATTTDEPGKEGGGSTFVERVMREIRIGRVGRIRGEVRGK
ncbi:MAG: hypothetical protein A2984_02405 [Omnitrophica WOR_2 bacterium RIFCSPLOWO2_01_FULL_41_12]|nr:MAG: hypothetical protein A2984_02405 [Omnitrophica WOR_2 bacterium RIFCSPLOWO2_01_FULL_41_12]